MIIFTIFALGLMVSFVVAKGLIQASDYAAKALEKQNSSVEAARTDEESQDGSQ